MKVISIVGPDIAGRATLVEKLVTELKRHGTVGTIMYTKDEVVPQAGVLARHLNSGAEATVCVTPTKMLKIITGTDLHNALKELSLEGLDFAVVDGFEQSDLPKIAIGDTSAANVVAKAEAGTTGEELAKIAIQQPEYVTLDYLIAKIKRSPKAKYAGAIGTFTGMVREIAGDEHTKALEFESYGEVAAEKISAIAEDLKKQKGILEVLIYHKTGRIEAGEDIVFIVILSGHREELFPALREAIERVKAEVPIWKKELTGSGDYWVHDIH
jgi:molybdopterin synthase catalytic subunit